MLRRRNGDNWRRGFDLTRPGAGRSGEQLLRLFAAADEPLRDDGAFLDARFRLAEGHRIDQRLHFARGEYALDPLEAELDDGVGLVAAVGPAALPVLFALDPGRPLRDTVAGAEADAAEVLPTMRRLYERGFLERA